GCGEDGTRAGHRAGVEARDGGGESDVRADGEARGHRDISGAVSRRPLSPERAGGGRGPRAGVAGGGWGAVDRVGGARTGRAAQRAPAGGAGAVRREPQGAADHGGRTRRALSTDPGWAGRAWLT